MKISTKATLIIWLTFFCGTACAQPNVPAKKYLLLISIDGLRPEFYLDQSWPAPTLQMLAAKGLSAKGVTSVFPSITFPAHTTIVTGKLPAEHGITGNNAFRVNETGPDIFSFDSIKCTTIWQLAHANNLTTAAVLWPVTTDAPIDYLVPEVWQTGNYKGYKYEPMFSVTKPASLMHELQNEAIGRLSNLTYHFKRYDAIDTRSALMSSYILEKYKPRLMATYLSLMDDAMHHNDPDGMEVRQSLALVDGCVFQLYKTLERQNLLDSTNIVIVGDHGHTRTDGLFAPNKWLTKNGIVIQGPNWDAKFFIAGGSAFLYINPAKPQKAILNKVTQTLAQLAPAIRKQITVISKKELTAMKSNPSAALAISAAEGFAFSDNEGANNGHGMHGALPSIKALKTGFILYGKDIKPGAIADMQLTDIFPILLKALNLNSP